MAHSLGVECFSMSPHRRQLPQSSGPAVCSSMLYMLPLPAGRQSAPLWVTPWAAVSFFCVFSQRHNQHCAWSALAAVGLFWSCWSWLCSDMGQLLGSAHKGRLCNFSVPEHCHVCPMHWKLYIVII